MAHSSQSAKAFQIVGPATENALSTNFILVHRMMQSLGKKEQSCRQDGSSYKDHGVTILWLGKNLLLMNSENIAAAAVVAAAATTYYYDYC